MSALSRALRWAFQVMWVASFVWLAGCLTDVLGWRGPGAVFIAWSVPSLPVFVATAEWRARHDMAPVATWVSALVAAWASVLWWLGATSVVPRSPAAFGMATFLMILGAVAVLVVQHALLHLSAAPSAPAEPRPFPRPRAVAALSGAR